MGCGKNTMTSQNLRISIGFLIAVLLAATTYFFVFSKPVPVLTNQQSGTRPAEAKSDTRDKGAVTSTTLVPIKQQKGPAKSLSNEYSQAENIAAFIAESLKRPGEGGRFYAHLAYWRCTNILPFRIDAQVKNLPAASKEQKAAIEAIKEKQARCKAVPEIYPNGIIKLLLDERGEQDPTLSIYNRFKLQEAPPAVAYADIQRALGGGDKFDIQEAISASKKVIVDETLRSYSNSLDENLVDAAFDAATCQVAGTCAEPLPLLGNCAVRGECKYKDWPEFLRAQYSDKELETFDQLRSEFIKRIQR
jgi:hypothetical protein